MYVYINGELRTAVLEYQNNRNRHEKMKKLLLHELSQKRKSLQKIAFLQQEEDKNKILAEDRDIYKNEVNVLKTKYKKDEMKILKLEAELKKTNEKLENERNDWKNTRDRLSLTIQTLNKEKQNSANKYAELEKETQRTTVIHT